jgi:hypothetical protein
METQYIEAGDIISCPECGAELLKCLERPEYGSTGYTDKFQDIGWGGESGDRTECPHDKAAWGVVFPEFSIHVQGKGWVSG